MGEVACRWRLSFSPDGRAFGIWSVIFAWVILSCLYQLGSWQSYVAAPIVNFLHAGAWIMCCLWVAVFSGSAGDAPAGLSLSLAALTLVSAAILALTAAAIEHAWSDRNVWRIVLVGAPLSLLAGWLATACTLSVGIAALACTQPPKCDRKPEAKKLVEEGRGEQGYPSGAYSIFTSAAAVDAASISSFVPLTLSAAVSVGALALNDPVLPLPLAWGVLFMRGHAKNWVAVALLIAVSVACVVLWVLNVFLAA